MPARVLVVEDDRDSRELLSTLLGLAGLEAVPVSCGAEAFDRVGTDPPDLILLDLMLPDMEGVEACRRLKAGPHAGIPVIIVTARTETGEKVAGLEAGADDYITKPFENAELIARVNARLRMKELETENLEARSKLERANARLRRYISELEASYLGTVASLSAAIEAKDPGTGGHVKRVVEYALAIGRRLDLSVDQMKRLHYAALLHDIGKIGIPRSLLDKKDELDAEEREALRRHPEISASILRPVGFLKDVIPIIRHHHEFLDGKGYPDALKGEGIPIESRIIAVADAYDAMISQRPYREALSREEAVARLEEGTGKQFDRRVVRALLAVLADGPAA
jgi:putative two-component system response regulator